MNYEVHPGLRDPAQMEHAMAIARGELAASINALQEALSVLERASWMADTTPDGDAHWRHGCHDLFAAASRLQRVVYKAARTGPRT